MHHCVAVCHFITSVFIYCYHYYFVLCISYNNWGLFLIIVLMSGFLFMCFIGKGFWKSHSFQSVLLYVGLWRHDSTENLKTPEKNWSAFLVIQYADFLVHTFLWCALSLLIMSYLQLLPFVLSSICSCEEKCMASNGVYCKNVSKSLWSTSVRR